jgi:hypothetical protein
MEVNDDAGVLADIFHCLAVAVGGTSTTLKQISQAWMHGGFLTAHYIFDMTQRGALCQGQPSKLGVVQFHVGWSMGSKARASANGGSTCR